MIHIEKEFQEKIPPMTENEFEQLKENILTAGEVYVPIVVWDDIIIDGHNRWKIVQEHPEIPYKTKEMIFNDKWEAFDWMYKNQLGRRNLTDEQRTYLLGKLYEARKHTHGETQDRDKDGTFRSSKSCDNGKPVFPNGRIKRIADIVGEEQNVSGRTVQSAYDYAKGIDVIRKTEPALVDSILNSKVKVTKKDIATIGAVPESARPNMLEAVKSGNKIKDSNKIKEDKNRLKQIKADIKQSRTVATYVPQINDLINDLVNNSTPYMRLLSSIIDNYAGVIAGNEDLVIETIDHCVTEKINEIKEKIRCMNFTTQM